MLFNREFGVILIVILNIGITTATSVNEQLKAYEKDLKEAEIIDNDKTKIDLWILEYSGQLLNITEKYRVRTTGNEEIDFGEKLDDLQVREKCVKYYRNTTRKLEQDYYLQEHKCLRKASIDHDDTRNTAMQCGGKIHQWRRVYKHHMKKCHSDHSHDEEKSQNCLIYNMERYNQSNDLKSLIKLWYKAILDWQMKMITSLAKLEDCLRSARRKYVTGVGIARMYVRIRKCPTLNLCHKKVNVH